LFNVTAGKDITLHECEKAAEIIKASADPSANIIFGVVNDDRMQDEVKITVIATGFHSKQQPNSIPATEPAVADYSAPGRRRRRFAPVEPVRPTFGNGGQEDLDIPAFLRNRF